MQPTELPLRDIHLPETISWFPPAIGWWILAIFIPFMIFCSIKFYKHITAQTALKTAKKLLTEMSNNSVDNKQKLSELSVLLRRVAISISKNETTASLTGNEWLIYLDNSLKDNSFSAGIGRCLIDAPYRNIALSDAELNDLLQLCSRWLKAQKG